MRLFKKIWNKILCFYYGKKGFSHYFVTFWRKEMLKSYKNSNISKKEKKWAFRKGFLPYRIKQYGLTNENYKNIISDRDYFYLYPINCRYSSWIDDKLTTKYVLAPFDEFLPKYYYHIMESDKIFKLKDCNGDYGISVKDVAKFIADNGLVAAKQAAGTYGIGFYRIQYQNGKYCVNTNDYEYNEFLEFLQTLDNYIITEYVEQHPDIKKLNPYSVNTIRVVAINENGNNPIIPFAFMRIGTKKSGFVDNVAQGGMVAKIDVDTGRFHSAETLANHVYYEGKYHPDTNEKIEGYIPNWNVVLKGIKDICNYCPQLKWLGFDIAITEDGFSIIEINSHQGLHKAHEYPKEVADFLHKELKLKKAKFKQK